MAANNDVGARILDAQARRCEQLAVALAAARQAGASPAELDDLADQERAARRRYQELAADIPRARRPWWRFW